MADSSEQLMGAILQAPQDDAPRLALADWLAGRGDPRGEFIRVQIELARLDPDADEAERLSRRERELLAEHEADWLGPLAGWTLASTFRRGFIEDVTVEAGALLAHVEDLFAATPIQSLRIHGAGKFCGDLAACRHLGRIRKLRFGSDDGDDAPVGDEGIADLAGSPHLMGLEAFALGMEQIGADALPALKGAPWLHTLHSLDLARNEIGDAALKSFLADAPLGQLEVLNIDWTGAGGETVAALAQSALGGLRELVLSNNKIGNAGVAELAASRLPQLISLDLTCTYLEPGALKPLCDAPLLATLSELRLGSNKNLEPADVSGLIDSVAFPAALKGLALGGARFGDAGAEVVARAVALRSLRRLELPMSGLTGAGVRALAASPHLTNLRAMELFSNRGTSAAAEAIAASKTLAGLRRLGLSNNQITDEGAQALAESPHLTSLRSLSLRANALTAKGVAFLAASANVQHLRSLDLGYLGLTDEAAKALAASPHLSNLEALISTSNKFSREGVQALVASFGRRVQLHA